MRKLFSASVPDDELWAEAETLSEDRPMPTPCINCDHTEHNGFHVCPVDGCMCVFSLHVSPPLERVSREEVSPLETGRTTTPPARQDIRFTAPEDENIFDLDEGGDDYLPDCMLCDDSGLMTSLDSNLKAIVLPCVCKVTEELPPTIRYCTCKTPGPTVPGSDSFGYCKTCGDAAR